MAQSINEQNPCDINQKKSKNSNEEKNTTTKIVVNVYPSTSIQNEKSKNAENTKINKASTSVTISNENNESKVKLEPIEQLKKECSICSENYQKVSRIKSSFLLELIIS